MQCSLNIKNKCTYVSVWVFVFVYLYFCTCVFVRRKVGGPKSVAVYLCLWISTCVFVCRRMEQMMTHLCMCLCICVFVFVYLYLCTCVFVRRRVEQTMAHLRLCGCPHQSHTSDIQPAGSLTNRCYHPLLFIVSCRNITLVFDSANECQISDHQKILLLKATNMRSSGSWDWRMIAIISSGS